MLLCITIVYVTINEKTSQGMNIENLLYVYIDIHIKGYIYIYIYTLL